VYVLKVVLFLIGLCIEAFGIVQLVVMSMSPKPTVSDHWLNAPGMLGGLWYPAELTGRGRRHRRRSHILIPAVFALAFLAAALN